MKNDDHTNLNSRDNAARIVAKAKALSEKQFADEFDVKNDEPKVAFKDLTFKQKMDHIWYYYKWVFTGILLAAVCIVSIIYTLFIKVKPDLWCGIAIYGENLTFEKTDMLTDELEDDFCIDTEHEEIQVTNYYSDSTDVMVAADLNQKFNTYVYSGLINLIVGTKEATQTFIEAEYIVPLTDYLSEDEIAALDRSGRIYYAEDIETNSVKPMAVVVNNPEKLNKYGIFTNEPAYLSFVPMAENIENTIEVMHEFMN